MQTLQKLQEMIECIIMMKLLNSDKIMNYPFNHTMFFNIFADFRRDWKSFGNLESLGTIKYNAQMLIEDFFSQEALAIAFETEETRIGNPDCYFSLLSKQMEQKRNELSTYLNEAGLVPITPGGGYFIVADISSIGMHIIMA